MVEELFDKTAEDVGINQRRDLVAELEFFQNLLDVRRKPVQVGLEVGLEFLLLGPGLEVPEGERGDVVKRVPGLMAQGSFLLDMPGIIEMLVQLEDILLGRFQHRIQPADDGHRQDYIPVLPRTYTSRSTSSAMPQINPAIQLRSPLAMHFPRWFPKIL